MRIATIVAFILAVAFAAADPFALLIKRESTTSMTSTASTDLPATPVTIALNLKSEVDSPLIGRSTDVPTEILTATPTATTDLPAASSSSSDDEYTYYGSYACSPRNATGQLDFNAPCNQYYTIGAQCLYGPQGVDIDVASTEEWQPQSFETQRTCICQSQMTDAVVGCMACMKAHKETHLFDDGGDAWISLWQMTTQQYCDVNFTPIQSFTSYFQDAQIETFGEDDPDDTPTVEQDPLGSSTDVSIYYTMSVTRSDAYDISVPTPAISRGDITYTSTRISNGQIIPTAKEQTLSEAVTSVAATASSAISPSSSYDYLKSVIMACHPRNATGYIDFGTPCNQLIAIDRQCSYGPRALQQLSLPFANDDQWPQFNGPEWLQQSPEIERICICQSQMNDAFLGCEACFKARGFPAFLEVIPRAFMRKYCDPNTMITQNFADSWSEASEDYGSSGDVTSASSYTGNPLGTSTDVSLYYTMSVTRSDAYNIAVPSSTSDGVVRYTSTRISDGQIVPTAEASSKQSSGEAGTSSIGITVSSTGGDATSTGSPFDSGAVATAHVGAAGLLAIAALAVVGL